nr:polysaccharide biosynthesis C-terminal domain-containing protein [uncultured Cohaesibacter sp.]
MTETAQLPRSGIWLKILRLMGNRDARGIFGTMVLKAASAGIAFALFSLAANAAGVEEFGRFSILFSALSILSIVAAAGQEMQVVRSWSEYLSDNRPGLALGALRYGWYVSFGGVVLICSLFWGAFEMDTNIFAETIKTGHMMAFASVAFLIGNTLALYSSHATRAIVGIRMADGHYEFTWRAFAVVFLIFSLFVGHPVTSTEIFAVFALGLAFVVATQAWAVNKEVKKQVGDVVAEYDVKQWTPRSVRFWLASIMEVSNQHMEVFIIGMLLDPISAGAYFVAVRLANAFALATSGLYTFGTRRVPSLYFSRNIPELKHTLNLMAGMSLIVVLVGMSAVVIGGDYMLMIFGRSYADYYWIFLILAIGTGMTAANGAAPTLLMLTGHEGRYVTIVTASVILRVAGFFLVVPHFGILGAAVVSCTVMVVMAWLTNYFCRSLTGMDSSIMRFIVESRDEPPTRFSEANHIPDSQ